MFSQVLGSAANVSAVAFLGLLAADLTGSDRLAGLPSATLTLGTAMLAPLLARRAIRRGRRPALVMGYLVGSLGAFATFFAGQAGVFLWLIPALLLLGSTQASGLQTRFAAADHAEPGQRARAISLVVWVSAIGGVLGPSLATWENDVGVGLGLRAWVSPLLLAGVLSLLAALVITIRLPGSDTTAVGGLRPSPRWMNTWQAVRTNRLALLGIVTVALSQAAMVAVMTMTPLHMRDHGHATLSGYVIALHVFGMFGLAPLVGRFVDRAGSFRAIKIGAVILGSGVLVSVVAGYQPALIFVGLFLLGLGWNFGLIAGSTLLTASVDIEHRLAAQGMSDTLLSVLGGCAALASGFIKQGWGFHWLANAAFALAVLVMVWALVVSRGHVRVPFSA